jgi:hypothetical protein
VGYHIIGIIEILRPEDDQGKTEQEEDETSL